MSYSQLKEPIVHGGPELPAQYYAVDAAHPRYVMPLHWHGEFEIDRILSGRFDAYVDNVHYPLQTGDVLMVNCGALHRGEPHDCAYECLVFDVGMLCKSSVSSISRCLRPLIDRTASVRAVYTAADTTMLKTVDALFTVMREQPPFYELQTFSLLFSLFAALYRNGDVVGTRPVAGEGRQQQAMATLLSWIGEHYTERITLAQLAAVCGFNEKYVCRFFRKYTAHSPMEYINQYRIAAACRAMTEQGLTVTEAALQNGFNDLSYFSKIFKREKGQTPQSYRRCMTAAPELS